MSSTHDTLDTTEPQSSAVGPAKSETKQPMLPLWRNRDYLLLWSGQFISSFGSQASYLAFPLLMLAITGSAAQAGLLGVIRSLPTVVFMLPAGALIDRWDRKRLMIICDLGRAIALGSIPIAAALNHSSVLQLYLVALIEGTLFTFFSLAETACLPNVVSQEQLSKAVSQSQSIDASAWLIGPSLSGLLYGIGRTMPFLMDGLTYLASVISLLFIKTQFQVERESEPRRLWAEIGEGVVWLWREPVIRFLAILTWGLLTPCFGYSLLLIVVAQNLHASPFIIGLLFGSGGVGSLIGSLLAAPVLKRFGIKRVLIVSTWIWIATWLPLAFAPNVLILGIVNAIGMIIVPIYMVTQYTYRLERIPDHLQGRVNSVFRLISFGSQPLGIGITGLLIQVIGPIATILVMFVPQALFAIAATFNRHIRAL